MQFIQSIWEKPDMVALEVYRMLVREQSLGIAYEAQHRADPVDPRLFTRESFLLSMREPQENDSSYQAHLELSKMMIASTNTYVTNPAITNAYLCGHPHNFTFRTGAPHENEQGLPSGKHSEKLVNWWMEHADKAIGHYQDAPDEERDLVTWLLHDVLYGLHLFDDANGRTARLHFLEPRRALRMPYVLFRYAEAGFYHRRRKYCRKKILTPILRQHGYL